MTASSGVANEGKAGFVVSHPCARKKAQRWGTEFCGESAPERWSEGPRAGRAGAAGVLLASLFGEH